MALPKRESKDRGNGGGNLFIKLKAKESVSGVFRGEPRFFCTKWIGGKSFETTDDDPDAKDRFRMNFVVKENGVYVAKIYEASGMTYDDLYTLEAQGYELHKTIVSITRHGDGKNTRYTFTPLPNGVLAEGETTKLLSVSLKDLEGKSKQEAPSEGPPATPGFDPNEDVPF